MNAVTRVVCTVGLALVGTSGVNAQPVTTIITHGLTTGNEKRVWQQAMGEAILSRAGEGSLYRYIPATGEWAFITSENDPTAVIVLLFNWAEESDFVQDGPNWGFTQAAADALYAALRDPHDPRDPRGDLNGMDLLTDRAVHFIGHSRGTCVNSEVVARLARAGIPVDQVTTLDPHPVNGTFPGDLDDDWGDPFPEKWENVAWADNYWRDDDNPLDFDGMPIDNVLDVQLDESALECCGYFFSHSDVHLWYHGTVDLSQNPCDGEECITDEARDSWWEDGFHWTDHGYYFSVAGGGSGDRPGPQPEGLPPDALSFPVNGSFDQGSIAGWLFHGGSIDADWIFQDGANFFLELGPDTAAQATHNRFFMDDNAELISFRYRVTEPSNDDFLVLAITDTHDGASYQSAAIPLNRKQNSFQAASVEMDAAAPLGRAYTMTVSVIDENGGDVEATVHIDEVQVEGDGDPDAPGDIDGDGTVGATDLILLLGAWGECDDCDDCAADLDDDCVVGTGDLIILLGNWG